MEHNDFSLDIIVTGGTIDKYYNPVQQMTLSKPDTMIDQYLDGPVQVGFDMHVHRVAMLDSRDIDDEIRLAIFSEVEKCGDHILISHGTDAMSDTAVFIDGKLGSDNTKTIILTGAMIPMDFHPSDAGFNLGYAIGQLKALDAGVYVCMNAMTFSAGTVQKDKDAGRFVSA